MPDSVYGTPSFPLAWSEMDWLQDLPKNTYFALWVNLPSIYDVPVDLPQGHPLYVISFHQERFDSDWIREQVKRISEPIIILCDESTYDFPLPDNVYCYRYHSWHYHIDQIIRLFPNRPHERNIKYKVSGICNRVTQSKLIVFTALMEYLDQQDLLIKLGNWVESKAVHHWLPTGNPILDQLTDVFKIKYLGTTIEIDDFDNSHDNVQSINSNPWQPTYTESALHFTNESYHYSLMDTGHEKAIMPGPSFSEKTFKCLVAGTPFIPVGQFETYKHLRDLGFVFDYGELDLTWDNDPGNLTRLSGIVDLIKSLKDYSTHDVIDMTKVSTEHNDDHVRSGKFQQICRDHNQSTAQAILDDFA